MPMSQAYQDRLFHRLPEIIKYFGTPFHIFDEQGIIESAEKLKAEFKHIRGYKEFFAVKALPNETILKILKKLGFGADCSSPSELILARRNGFKGEDIMFSSNNTTVDTFKAALADGGCMINIDDITMIDNVNPFPELICFRYNPGERRTGNAIIGEPVESKYGLRHDQVIPAYKKAIERGAKRFGIHAFIVSNERNYKAILETVQMLLDIVAMVTKELGIKFEFINISGGAGIAYRPEHNSFDFPALAKESKPLFDAFTKQQGYTPKLFTEFGRYITGPHGVLVATVVNRMSKYREYVGVDVATMAANPRPAIYESAYHHITILDPQGKPKHGGEEVVDVIGPLCENNDKFAKQRTLPRTQVGDIMVQHDTGAHSPAMCSNYNGWMRTQELLLKTDGTVELIRRGETFDDLFATLKFKKKVLKK
jgi:diaminopimelate decarboxylase